MNAFYYNKKSGVTHEKKKKLIVNSDKGNLLNELISSINECKRFYFSVAFINFSGLQLLLEAFKEAEDRGVRGQIITSTYLNFTEAKALKRINEFENIQLKVFETDKTVGFHTKAYNQYDFKAPPGLSTR